MVSALQGQIGRLEKLTVESAADTVVWIDGVAYRAGAESVSGASIPFTGEEDSLAPGESITSEFIDNGQADKIQITFVSDSLGLTLTQESKLSVDGNVRAVTVPITSTNGTISVPARLRFGRFTLTNASSEAITNVGLQIKQTFGSSDKASTIALSSPPIAQSQATLTQSVISGKDPEGGFVNGQVNRVGALLVSDFGTEVARNIFDEYEINTTFGRNPNIDTGTTPEDIWNGGGVYPGFNPVVGENLEVFSDSAQDSGALVTSGTMTGATVTTVTDANAAFITDGVAPGDIVIDDDTFLHGFVDQVVSETELTVFQWTSDGTSGLLPAGSGAYRIATSTGTGAAVVKWFNPLDSDFNRVNPVAVILDGTNPVVVPGDFIRTSFGSVLHAGSSGVNEGTITARQETTTANIFAAMPAGLGQTAVGAFTVPAGETCLIKRVSGSITRTSGAAGSSTIVLFARERGGAFNAERVYELAAGSQLNEDMVGGILLAPKTDVKFTVVQVSDNNTIATMEAEYFFIETLTLGQQIVLGLPEEV